MLPNFPPMVQATDFQILIRMFPLSHVLVRVGVSVPHSHHMHGFMNTTVVDILNSSNPTDGNRWLYNCLTSPHTPSPSHAFLKCHLKEVT